MTGDFPPNTRGIWPFEQSSLLDFTFHPDNQNDSPADVNHTFKGMVTELFNEVMPECLRNEPYSQHKLAFSITPDIHSKIVVVVIKQGKNVDLSDQIIVQDRLFGRIREEYIYQNTDGRDSEVVRIRCGDIAAQNQSVITGDLDILINDTIEREHPVSNAELEAVMSLTVMGNVVNLSDNQAEQLHYPYIDRAATA